jgi:hypothetical protein
LDCKQSIDNFWIILWTCFCEATFELKKPYFLVEHTYTLPFLVSKKNGFGNLNHHKDSQLTKEFRKKLDEWKEPLEGRPMVAKYINCQIYQCSQYKGISFGLTLPKLALTGPLNSFKIIFLPLNLLFSMPCLLSNFSQIQHQIWHE